MLQPIDIFKAQTIHQNSESRTYLVISGNSISRYDVWTNFTKAIKSFEKSIQNLDERKVKTTENITHENVKSMVIDTGVDTDIGIQ